MAGDEVLEIRDLREKHFFMVDDLLLDAYAARLGPHTTLVYISLCRHANKFQISWPSIDRLAEKTAVSRSGVLRGLRELEKARLIKVERHRGRPNIYVLRDRSAWVPPDQCQGDTSVRETPVSGRHYYQCQGDTTTSVRETPEGNTEGNTLKETHTVRETFERFWTDYPKKTGGKSHAETAWNRINPDEAMATLIMEGLERAKGSTQWSTEGGRYIPTAERFLDSRGWEKQYRHEPKPDYLLALEGKL